MLGTRQSGLAQFRVARLPEDAELLDGARARSAPRCSRPIPELALPEHALLDWAVRVGLRRRRARPDPRVSLRVIAGRYGGRRLQARPATRRAPRPTACARRCSRSSARAWRARACSTCSPAPARSGSRRSRAGRAQATFVDSARGRAAGAARQPRGARRRRRGGPRGRACAGSAPHPAARANTISCSSIRPTGRRRRWEPSSRTCCPRCWRRMRSWSPRVRPPRAARARRSRITDERRYGDTLIRIHGT